MYIWWTLLLEKKKSVQEQQIKKLNLEIGVNYYNY